MELDLGVHAMARCKVSEGQKLFCLSRKAIVLYLSLANITTVSNFTGYTKMKLMSHSKSKEMLLLPQDYASNIFTRGQSFNDLMNLKLLFPLLDYKVFILRHAPSIRLPITTTKPTIIIATVNLENYY